MLGRFFRRRRREQRRPTPPLIIPPQPTAARDWEAGDVAKCIGDDRRWVAIDTNEVLPGPRRGQILRVAGVLPAYGTLWLSFVGFRGSYSAGWFRKLRPCETGFLEQLARPSVPTRVKAPDAIPELVP